VPAGGGGPVIHLGADAISAVDPDGDAATVRYDECAVVLAHPDGSRLLIGHDGIVVAVDLDRYADLNAALIDRRVPAGLLVSLPGVAPSPAPGVGALSVGRLASFLRLLTPAWLRLGALGLVTAVVGGAVLAYTLAMVFGLLDEVRLLSVIGGWLIAGWFGRAFLRAWTARRARA
jgi:hypothetical protein